MNPQNPNNQPDQPSPQEQPIAPAPVPAPEPLAPPSQALAADYTQAPLIERIMSHWLVSWILIPAGLIFFLHYFVFSAYHVIGSSMVSTLHDSDYLIIAKVNKTKSMVTRQPYIPAREQVIVFKYPKQPELEFVKRVVGLPGDRVVVREGLVRVYNSNHPEGLDPDSVHQINGTYTQGDPADNPIDVVVPNGNIFVMGDNRAPNASSDSREWGFVPADNIIGNVILRLYPFDKVRTFTSLTPQSAKN